MMNIDVIERILEDASRKLDISPTLYRQAQERFISISEYLEEGRYKGSLGKPDIFLQGSFKLGTEIRPCNSNDDADYDIDLVCVLQHSKESTSPKVVKAQVGDQLKRNANYGRMLKEEGKRCWTIDYAEQNGLGFHIDILPSVKNTVGANQITDRFHDTLAVTTKNKKTGEYDWSLSNPKGFAEWFFERNRIAFQRVKKIQKSKIFDRYKSSGLFLKQEDVPNIHVKTPLQRSIQLLKRHRDIFFAGEENEKCKPISMIITVLAATIYNNEETIYDTLKNIINTLAWHAKQIMGKYDFNEKKATFDYPLITRLADGTWEITNPTCEDENFAERWHEEVNGIPHARAVAFFEWIIQAKHDFIDNSEHLNEENYKKILFSMINENIFNVDHKESVKWPLKLNNTVNVTGAYKDMDWHRFESGEPLNKGLDLKFQAVTTVEQPYDVYWQVVNTGKEATEAKQLRGEIFHSQTAGVGGLTQKESTRYTGVHWIECFIVKDGCCVARSGEYIVRIV